MNAKLKKMALWSFVLAVCIYLFSYVLYHYLDPAGGFTSAYQSIPAKPMVTAFFAIWGVMHQFAAVTCLLMSRIVYPNKDK